MNRKHITDTFAEYTKKYDATDGKIKLNGIILLEEEVILEYRTEVILIHKFHSGLK